MKTVFPEKSIKAIYKTGKNLKESSPSPAISINKKSNCCSIINCNTRCDTCTNFMIFDITFKCAATGKYYKVKWTLSSNSTNVVYLIICQCCRLQRNGSAIVLKEKIPDTQK